MGAKAERIETPPSKEKVPARRAPLAESSSARERFLPSKRQAAIFPSPSEFSGSYVPGVTMRVTLRSTRVRPSGSVICSQIATRKPAETSLPR